MIKQKFLKIVNGQNLNMHDAEYVMRNIMSGRVSPIQIGAILTALRSKGETSEEISAFARVLKDFAVQIQPNDPQTIDTCGTGGCEIKTANISTTTAFIIAGLGIPVAKHGNRSVTSKSGSADVLEYLGLNLNQTPQEVEESLHSCGICFMFAPTFHPAMKYAVQPRKDLGIRTVFNILGPLINPANVKYQVLGVFDPDMTETMAKVLRNLGTKHALIVHGVGGLDEISVFGKTKVTELFEGKINTHYLSPKDFGLEPVKRGQIEKMGTAKENAEDLVAILNGKKSPVQELILANAAGALKAAKNIPYQEGITLAKESITSGKAYEKLKAFIQFNSGNTAVLDHLEDKL